MRVACTESLASLKVKYVFLQKFQGTSGQVLNAFDDIFFVRVELQSLYPLQSITGNTF